jgi:hypothetical protein
MLNKSGITGGKERARTRVRFFRHFADFLFAKPDFCDIS